MPSPEYQKYGTCDECDPFGDSFCCVCPTPPLEDYENGYCNELTSCTLDWYDHANSQGWPGIHRFLKLRYESPSRVEQIAMTESPIMRMLRNGRR